MRDLCVAGHAAVDFILKVPVLSAKPSQHTYAESFTREFGGQAATMAVVAKSLGLATGLYATLGDDLYGRLYLRYLQGLKVDVSHVKIAKEQTARSFSVADNSGREHNYFYEGAGRFYPEIDLKWLNKYKALHLVCRDVQTNLALANSGYSGLISYDPGFDLQAQPSPRAFRELLKKVIIFMPNEVELNQVLVLLDLKTPKDILKLGPEIILVSRGAGGSKLIAAKEDYRLPALAAKKISPTGSGEALRAGFLAAFLKGLDLAKAHKMGAVTAAFVLEAIGAQTKVPTWAEVEERYARYEREKKI